MKQEPSIRYSCHNLVTILYCLDVCKSKWWELDFDLKIYWRKKMGIH